MIHEIGETAGQVWQVLNENGAITFPQLKKKVKTSEELLNQSIGWLAREDKLTMEKNGKSLRLTLK